MWLGISSTLLLGYLKCKVHKDWFLQGLLKLYNFFASADLPETIGVCYNDEHTNSTFMF